MAFLVFGVSECFVRGGAAHIDVLAFVLRSGDFFLVFHAHGVVLITGVLR